MEVLMSRDLLVIGELCLTTFASKGLVVIDMYIH